MSAKSLTEVMVDAMVRYMDANDLSPVTFLRDDNGAYTCIGSCRGLSNDLDEVDGFHYFMTVGVQGFGLLSEGKLTEDRLRGALKDVLKYGMRGYDAKGKVINFM
jgi:hypothetical protein